MGLGGRGGGRTGGGRSRGRGGGHRMGDGLGGGDAGGGPELACWGLFGSTQVHTAPGCHTRLKPGWLRSMVLGMQSGAVPTCCSCRLACRDTPDPAQHWVSLMPQEPLCTAEFPSSPQHAAGSGCANSTAVHSARVKVQAALAGTCTCAHRHGLFESHQAAMHP